MPKMLVNRSFELVDFHRELSMIILVIIFGGIYGKFMQRFPVQHVGIMDDTGAFDGIGPIGISALVKQPVTAQGLCFQPCQTALERQPMGVTKGIVFNLSQIVESSNDDQGIAIERNGVVGGDIFGPQRRVNGLLSVKEGLEIAFQDIGRMDFDRELAFGRLKDEEQF